MFKLPPLPFQVSEVTPALSVEQIDAHYNHHHRTYVQNLNELVEGTILADAKLLDVIRYSSRLTADSDRFQEIWQNACQHYLHSMYWNCLGPTGNPDSVKGLDEFRTTAISKFGDGWVYLLPGGTVGVLNDTGLPPPEAVLVIDVWEHAYYLDYRWEREKYVDAFLSVVDWDTVKQTDSN